MKTPSYLDPKPDDTVFDRFCKWCFQSYDNMIAGVLAVASFVTFIGLIGVLFLMRVFPAPPKTVVEATTTTMTTTTTTTNITTTTTVTTVTSTTTTEMTTTTTTVYDPKARLIDYGYFKGTYYNGATNPCNGGSGRTLIDCTPKSDETKGSVACRRIFEDYGYNVNGRTRVYLEFDSYPSMDGWYFVDDCCASLNVVDVYFANYATCPWQNDGTTSIHLWMEVS